MNKNELISNIADKAGLTKTEAGKAVNSFISAITDSLAKGQEIRLVGFGTFSVSKRAAKTGRNPRTGATIQIKARKLAKFKAGKTLQNAIN